jgi:hypothetical protein
VYALSGEGAGVPGFSVVSTGIGAGSGTLTGFSAGGGRTGSGEPLVGGGVKVIDAGCGKLGTSTAVPFKSRVVCNDQFQISWTVVFHSFAVTFPAKTLHTLPKMKNTSRSGDAATRHLLKPTFRMTVLMFMNI